ncbi:MAG: glycosyltransferase family 4 protein [Bryobacterales bacterium]|nr:glycosyltransferase family 4 protein [Bryobacterales bacterium]
MLYAIDAHAIGCRLTGNEVYIRNLLENLSAADPSARFIAYRASGAGNGWTPEGVSWRATTRNPFLRLGFDLGHSLRRDRPALLHVQYTAPLGCPVPVVVSVHDVSFLEHPEFFQFLRARQLRLTVSRTVKTAAKVVTGSEFSRGAIARAYGMDPASIAVVPNAASAGFRPLDRAAAAQAVLARFGIPGPFLLAVGDLQPRKNQVGLVRAFAKMAADRPRLKHSLVLAGKDTWFSKNVREAVRASRIEDRVCFPGFVTDEELLLLYNACAFFVCPSLYEGFGLPLLEAMACGRAVACSNVSACPEVAGAAAVFFNPHDTEGMARVLTELAVDREFRAHLETQGLSRAAQFSWRKTAGMMVSIYRGVAKLGARSPDPAAVLP